MSKHHLFLTAVILLTVFIVGCSACMANGNGEEEEKEPVKKHKDRNTFKNRDRPANTWSTQKDKSNPTNNYKNNPTNIYKNKPTNYYKNKSSNNYKNKPTNYYKNKPTNNYKNYPTNNYKNKPTNNYKDNPTNAWSTHKDKNNPNSWSAQKEESSAVPAPSQRPPPIAAKYLSSLRSSATIQNTVPDTETGDTTTGNGQWRNVASLDSGATCTAVSSEELWRTCDKALDGCLLGGYCEWATKKGGQGSWIKIQFNDTYDLTYARIMQRYSMGEQFQEISLEFDDGTKVKKHLKQSTAPFHFSYTGQQWNEWPLQTKTSAVTITSLSPYFWGFNPGFIEIEFYTGTYPCPQNFTRVQDECYHYKPQLALTYNEQETYCRNLGACLATFNNFEDLYYVTTWLAKSYAGEYGLWIASNQTTTNTLDDTEQTQIMLDTMHGGYQPKRAPVSTEAMALCQSDCEA